MNITGEYIVHYNIYTMFDVYEVKIKNHNLITTKGYEFFLSKWYEEEICDIQLGYFKENHFYKDINYQESYATGDGLYSKVTNYIDKKTNKQYRYDGTKFIDFAEKLNKICIGDSEYINSYVSIPKKSDTELNELKKEYELTEQDNFEKNGTELILKVDVETNDLNGTTEIGVKTNRGRLVSHDIHPPYNLPFGTLVKLEYIFKLK